MKHILEAFLGRSIKRGDLIPILISTSSFHSLLNEYKWNDDYANRIHTIKITQAEAKFNSISRSEAEHFSICATIKSNCDYNERKIRIQGTDKVLQQALWSDTHSIYGRRITIFKSDEDARNTISAIERHNEIANTINEKRSLVTKLINESNEALSLIRRNQDLDEHIILDCLTALNKIREALKDKQTR